MPAPPRLHFGFILSSLHTLPGGLETMARGLAQALAARGHRVTTIAGRALEKPGCSVPGIESLEVSSPSLTGPLSRQLKRLRPGWALALQSRTFLLACRATPLVFRRILECSVTVTFLEMETVAISEWRAALGRPNVAYFPGVVRWRDLRRDRSVLRLAASETLAAHYRHLAELPIHGVLYPGIDDVAEVRTTQAEVERVLFVGRLETNKGIATLLDLARNLSGNGPQLELRLAGDGPMRGEVLRAAQARSGGAVRLVCLGPLTPAEVRRELQSTDLFLFPSRYESFGIAVLEALAAGIPVVCSDLPALREVAGEAAIFVPAADTNAWIEATTRLLHDRGLRERLSELGAIRARRFTWAATVETLEAHAYRVMSGASGSASGG